MGSVVLHVNLVLGPGIANAVGAKLLTIARQHLLTAEQTQRSRKLSKWLMIAVVSS